MPSPSLAHTLHDARVRWLGGDAAAWTQYAACCHRLGTETRSTTQPVPSPIPLGLPEGMDRHPDRQPIARRS